MGVSHSTVQRNQLLLLLFLALPLDLLRLRLDGHGSRPVYAHMYSARFWVLYPNFPVT